MHEPVLAVFAEQTSLRGTTCSPLPSGVSRPSWSSLLRTRRAPRNGFPSQSHLQKPRLRARTQPVSSSRQINASTDLFVREASGNMPHTHSLEARPSRNPWPLGTEARVCQAPSTVFQDCPRPVIQSVENLYKNHTHIRPNLLDLTCLSSASHQHFSLFSSSAFLFHKSPELLDSLLHR